MRARLSRWPRDRCGNPKRRSGSFIRPRRGPHPRQSFLAVSFPIAFARLRRAGDQARYAGNGDRSGAGGGGGTILPEEINEFVNVLQKLYRVRDVILKVNLAYIASAAQEDAYRTEPPFKLQGSYRDMNKIIEKLNPIMNDEELQTLILSHYQSESQTLTSGAESNLLKFKAMYGVRTTEEDQRYTEIVAEFQRLQKINSGGNQHMGRILEQMEAINYGLQNIGLSLKHRADDSSDD